MAKRGRKQIYNLVNEACPNPKCDLHGKAGKDNIVLNGTIKTKQGKNRQKFFNLCGCCLKPQKYNSNMQISGKNYCWFMTFDFGGLGITPPIPSQEGI